MNCCKKAAVNVLHRSFYVIGFIMCRFPLIVIGVIGISLLLERYNKYILTTPEITTFLG